jgi:acetyltransferase-like isoleucine patch superfamily enzyme
MESTLKTSGTGEQIPLRDSYIHETCKIYGSSTIGKNCTLLEFVLLGYPTNKILSDMRSSGSRLEDFPFIGVNIGDNAVIRSSSVIYADVRIGSDLRTGHHIMVRESTTIGDGVLIGTNSVIDGSTNVGNHVSIQSNVYIPTNTVIEDNVFLGPCASLANDKYPIRVKYDLRGPILRKGASVGANATILPGVEIGEGAMVAAGAVVTKDVPAWKLAIGSPARIKELPEGLLTLNKI